MIDSCELCRRLLTAMWEACSWDSGGHERAAVVGRWGLDAACQNENRVLVCDHDDFGHHGRQVEGLWAAVSAADLWLRHPRYVGQVVASSEKRSWRINT